MLAGVVLTLVGCNSTDSVGPDSSSLTPSDDPGSTAGAELTPLEPQFATAYAGGMPFGTFDQPNAAYGSRFDGAMRIIGPYPLLSDLREIKSRGGKVIINFAGGRSRYLDAAGNFSFTLWKQSVDRFKGINFSSYINDGTIVAHYLIDEPHNVAKWNGKTVSQSTLDAMAQYSKQLWPGMTTVVRAYPDYLANWSGTYQYLDAAWAQYVERKGPAGDFLAQSVADAKRKGLGLVVGLNILQGGPNGTAMTASQVQSWGSTLLSSSYPCAFISWEYDEGYLSSGAIQDAMDVLRAKAKNRSTTSCKDPSPESSPEPAPAPSASIGALPFGLALAPAAEYSTRWTGALYRATPSEAVKRLASAKSAGMRVVIQMATKARSVNADGTFSLTRWKAAVDQYRALSLGTYTTSGTLYLHHLVDRPNCASCWGGKVIPGATVEAMAQYSKSIWPTLPTSVQVPPSVLAAASFRWEWLDAGGIIYNTRQGDPRAYLANQVATAKLEGLSLVVGLNLLNSAGYRTSPMTPSQIKQFGTILAQEPSACALVGWTYNATYLGQTGIREALDSVTRVAKRRTPGSCVVS